MKPEVQESDGIHCGPCVECGNPQSDPYSGLCERCLFGPLNEDEYDPYPRTHRDPGG